MAGAGYKSFTAGSILTASDVNSYLMQQSHMTFASTAARDAAITAPSEGMVCTTTDTDTFYYYNGTAWVSTGKATAWTTFTPSWTNLTIGNGTTAGAYFQFGKLVAMRYYVRLGTSSTMGSNPYFTLPVNAVTNLIGSTDVYSSRGVAYGFCTGWEGELSTATNNGTQLQFRYLAATSATGPVAFSLVTATAPGTWGSTHTILGNVVYEAS